MTHVGSTKYGVTRRAIPMDFIITYTSEQKIVSNEVLLNDLWMHFKQKEETTGESNEVKKRGHYFSLHHRAKKVTIEITIN